MATSEEETITLSISTREMYFAAELISDASEDIRACATTLRCQRLIEIATELDDKVTYLLRTALAKANTVPR
jgi:hypothetical protein